MDRTTTSPEFKPTLIWIGIPSVRLYSLGIAFHRLLHPERRVAGAHRVIFVSQRRTEQRHDAVAHDLIDCSLIAMHCFHHVFEDWIKKFPRLFRITVGEQFHRAFHVSEQHRDLFALAFESALGDQNFFGEMLGSVGVGRIEVRRSAE